jgi:hypothetical protein
MNNMNINQTNNERKTGLIITLLSLVTAGFALGAIPTVYIPIGIAIIVISIITIVKRKNNVRTAAIVALVTTLIGMGLNTTYLYNYGKMMSLEKEIVSKSKNKCNIVTEGFEKLVYCQGITSSEKTELKKIVDEWENTTNSLLVITIVTFIYSIIWLILNTVLLGMALAKIKNQNDLERFANYGLTGNFQYGLIQNMNPQPQYGQIQSTNTQPQYSQIQSMNPQSQYGQVQNVKPQPQFDLAQSMKSQFEFNNNITESSIKPELRSDNNSNLEKNENIKNEFPPKFNN